MRTNDQEYSVQIFAQVTRMSTEEEAARDKYGSMAHRLPVLIRTAGLAQALGFVQSRGTPEQQQLIQDISEVVGVSNICEGSREAELGEYMRLTRDVMAALVWYKRFAESVLDVQSDADGKDAGE